MTAKDVVAIIRQKICDAEQAGVSQVPLSNLRGLIDQIDRDTGFDPKMNSLKRKTIWEDNKEDDEKNTLIVRIKETQTIGSPEPSPKKRTGSVKIVSPGEDEYGRPCKKRLRIDVDQAFVSEIKDAVGAICSSEPRFRPSETTSQVRYEGKSRLVVMWEVLPFATMSELKPRYVIGNGEDIRFILGEFSDVEAFYGRLESALK